MKNIVFMGTPDFAVPVLQQLINDQYNVIAVVTQPDRPKGRKKVLTPPPVKVEAEKHKIPIYQPEKIRLEEEYKKIIELQPDLIVTAAFGQILPKSLLDAPKYGCVNVHASLLPKLRGGAPIHYSIIQGEAKTGVTIMYMVEKLDAGDILTQVEVEILESDHVGTLHDKLSVAGSKLLSETLPLLFEGKLNAIKQNDDEATFAYNIKREQEKIDWSKDGEGIYNHIRGLHPWPVAYTTLDGQAVKVWWGEKISTTKSGNPGEVIHIENDGFVVKTGNNIGIKITDLQPAGKKRMTGEQYLNGAGSALKEGALLD
ncbi:MULTISPECIES: methionyl-tRNA formyltransferase [Sutcliffiella]|uniref:Methionyl-tRNA formyltransferase n=1 Tax=Sutcliffiella cohnii TaxID=33932 RepID=A0A223KS11_9BACI|nr:MULTISPECIES: methionyl-tRNA formyltransferase [Sutcliffiella]AST92103.1 methionyl-tRNA formyltransferase [Sutcliffiella cohnii]MED4015389.1 methionyl-tRNA formyltransferase [Sutcliffiella cohnii]WBL13334.1 methionyl-tRNA formyltransferase [Sutcliffiella sp. NC1]